MKAILIKGMEMPKNCLECKLQYYDDENYGYCFLTNVECLNIGRQDACPLEEPKTGKYSREELKQFASGISLALLSKRSAQRWDFDEKTAEEIRFLEGLYEKVRGDMEEQQ